MDLTRKFYKAKGQLLFDPLFCKVLILRPLLIIVYDHTSAVKQIHTDQLSEMLVRVPSLSTTRSLGMVSADGPAPASWCTNYWEMVKTRVLCSIHGSQRVRLFAIPWTTAHQASLSFINSQGLLKLMFIESVVPSNHLILYRPLLLPSVFPSR